MPDILVVGSINMDVVIRVDTVPQGGESCLCREVQHVPGGKGANQAIAASRLNANSSLYCKIGRDDFGQTLQQALAQERVHTEYVQSTAAANTGVAYILLEQNGQNRIMVDAGANMCYDATDLPLLERAIAAHEIILLQLEIPLETVADIIQIARRLGKKIIVDAGPARQCPLSIFNGVDILSPNETETTSLTGMAIHGPEDRLQAAHLLLDQGVKAVVLKMGSHGSMYVDRTQQRHFPPYQTKVVDTTAAGDAFTSALGVALLQGQSIFQAVDFANKVGALAVSKLGAQPSMPYLAEVNNATWQQVT